MTASQTDCQLTLNFRGFVQKVLFVKKFIVTHWDLLESLFCALCLCLHGRSLDRWLNLLSKSVSLYQFFNKYSHKRKMLNLYLLIFWIANVPGHLDQVMLRNLSLVKRDAWMSAWAVRLLCYLYSFPARVCELHLPTKKRSFCATASDWAPSICCVICALFF